MSVIFSLQKDKRKNELDIFIGYRDIGGRLVIGK